MALQPSSSTVTAVTEQLHVASPARRREGGVTDAQLELVRRWQRMLRADAARLRAAGRVRRAPRDPML